MAFSLISRGLLRTSRELLERNMAVGAVSIFNGFVDIEMHVSFIKIKINKKIAGREKQKIIEKFIIYKCNFDK